MGIREDNPSFGKAIHVRRQRLRMSAKKADPIVQVIDGDEQDIGTVKVRRIFR